MSRQAKPSISKLASVLLAITLPLSPVTGEDDAAQIDTQISTSPLLPDLTDPATEVLSLEGDGHRRYTIPVSIDGAGPYNFMIDTGSQATAVTERITNQIDLPLLGPATIVGMASRRVVDMVELDNFEVGTRTIHNLAAPVLQAQHVGADGIIGLDSLQDFRVLIDFRDETIAVAETSRSNSAKGYEIIVRARSKLGQLLITNAVVEGVKATVIIDTGAQASLGNMALRERIRTKRAREQVKTTDVNGVSITSDLTYARSLVIHGMELRNVPITYADTPAFDALGLRDKPVLSLGMQHLKMFDRIAIDFTQRRILFDLPRDVARAFRRARNSSF